MIPVEYLWLTLISVFAIVGMVRGVWQELGVTTVLLLSLFVLQFAWDQIGAKIAGSLPGQLPVTWVQAIYYSVSLLIVAFIAYEGFTLRFPIKEMKGISKALLGLPSGILNGYLIFGTIWDVVNQAKYLAVEVPLGSSGTTIAISDYLTQLHNSLAQYLPVTFVNEFVMLALGMILLLAIILK